MHQCGKALSTLDVSPSKPPDPPPHRDGTHIIIILQQTFFDVNIFMQPCVCVYVRICVYIPRHYFRATFIHQIETREMRVWHKSRQHTHIHTLTPKIQNGKSAAKCARDLFVGFVDRPIAFGSAQRCVYVIHLIFFFVCGIIKSNFSRIRQQHVVFRSAFGQYDTVDYRFVSFRSRRKEKIYPRKHNG